LKGRWASDGEILWKKPVPNGPVTGQSRIRRHAYAFRRGPDGYIRANFAEVLVRIDPTNAKIIPVGRLPEAPRQIAFAGGEVYVAGAGTLRQKPWTHPVWTSRTCTVQISGQY